MELNPNHEVTNKMRDQWHKIALLLMMRMGETHVVITVDEIEKMAMAPPDEALAITIHEERDGLHVEIVSFRDGMELARKEGGLPI